MKLNLRLQCLPIILIMIITLVVITKLSVYKSYCIWKIGFILKSKCCEIGVLTSINIIYVIQGPFVTV